MSAPILDRETILKAIRDWPPEDQVALAQDILQMQRVHAKQSGSIYEPAPLPPSWNLAGIAAIPGKTPPTDKEVQQLLDQRRTEKYGG